MSRSIVRLLSLPVWVVCLSACLADPSDRPSTPLSQGLAAPREQLPFVSVARGDSFTADLTAPTLLVAGSPDEARHLTMLLSEPEMAHQVAAVDVGADWVVAVFRGRMGSSGYGVTIQEICRKPDRVQIIVELTDPDPAQNVSDVITYPYHVVRVPRDRVPDTSGMVWAVYATDGTLLAETVRP